MAKLCLLTLPPWILSCPPISLPILAAVCRAEGIDCRCIDGNLLFYEYVLSRPSLRACFEELRQRQATTAVVTGTEQLLLRGLLSLQTQLLEESSQVASVLKGESAASAEFCQYALNTQRHYFQLLSKAHGFSMDRDGLELPIMPQTLGQLVTHAVQVEWPLLDDFFDRVLLERIGGDSTALGISVHTVQHAYLAVRLATHVRRHLPRLPIVVGGTFLTTYAPQWPSFGPLFEAFDYVVVHDGEEALPMLLHRLASGGRIDDVPNLIWRGPDRKLRSNPVRLVPPEAFAPVPDYDDLDLAAYHAPRSLASIPIARGCFYDCAYCNYPAVGGNKFRVDPAASVVDKVEWLSRRHGIESFFFSVAVLPPTLAKHLAQTLLERKVKIRWGTGARFERGFTPELCRLLEESGCTRIDFGAESGDADVLRRMHKGLQVEDYEAAVENFSGTSINRHFYMIMNFPGETVESFRNSAAFLRRAAQGLCSFNFFNFTLAPGSPVHQDPQRYGVEVVGQAGPGDLCIAERHDDPAVTPEQTQAKLDILGGLARDLREDFEYSDKSFHHRQYVPEFALQLTLPEGGRLPRRQHIESDPWKFDSSVQVVDIGTAEIKGTRPAGYRLLRSRRNGRVLVMNHASWRYLTASKSIDAPAPSFGVHTQDEVWSDLFDLVRRADMVEPSS